MSLPTVHVSVLAFCYHAIMPSANKHKVPVWLCALLFEVDPTNLTGFEGNVGSRLLMSFITARRENKIKITNLSLDGISFVYVCLSEECCCCFSDFISVETFPNPPLHLHHIWNTFIHFFDSQFWKSPNHSSREFFFKYFVNMWYMFHALVNDGAQFSI